MHITYGQIIREPKFNVTKEIAIRYFIKCKVICT